MSKTNDKDVNQQQQQGVQQAPPDGGAGAAAASADDQGLEQNEAALWAQMDKEEAAAAGTDAKGSDAGAAAADPDQSGDGVTDPEAGSDDALADGGAAGDKTSADKGKKGPDIWANASPEQRAAFEAAQAEAQKGEQYKKSNEGRMAALQRQVSELKRQLQQAAPGGAAGGSGGKQQQAGGGYLDSPEYKKYVKEYPEIAGPLGKVIAELQSQITSQTKILSAIGDERRQAALSEQEELLSKDHADWSELASQEAFGDWLANQPRHIREAAARNGDEIVDASEAADVIGRYKQHLINAGQYKPAAQQQGSGTQQQNKGTQSDKGAGNGNQALDPKRQRQLGSAASSKSRGPGVASGIAEDADPKTIWKQMDAEEARQGRAQA